jgi:glucokinase
VSPRAGCALILAGDVGGTKALLGLFAEEGKGLRLVREAVYPSQEFPSLEAIVEHFFAGTAPPALTAACFGVAGPVIDGRSATTNLPWIIDERTLSTTTPVPRARLLNDLEATAWGVLGLAAAELAPLQTGTRRDGHRALIAAGTGLGEALIVRDGGRHVVVASEGGHADFAPRTEREDGLLRFLRREYGHVSYERVLSGPGLYNVYRFARATSGLVEPGWLRDRMAGGDPSAVVSEVALAGEDVVCEEALDTFAAVYGAEAGNLALRGLAVGGVFLGGGIAPKILAKLGDGTFTAAFRDKGRFRELLEAVPVAVVLNPRVALLGAAHAARTSPS